MGFRALLIILLAVGCTDEGGTVAPGAETEDAGFRDVVDAHLEDLAPRDADLDADVGPDAASDVGSDAAPADRPDLGSAPDGFTPQHALDDVLRFNHVQALGTHNSYHQRSFIPAPQWAYDHLPLDAQLDEQGVRQFELDLYQNGARGSFDVYHVPLVDAASTCPSLTACLSTMKRWSDAHLGHHPLMLLLEVKAHGDDLPSVLAALEEIILAVWPRDRLVVPDLVQRDHENARDGIAAEGWPTLGALRGRLMVVLHEGGDLRATYTDGGTTTAGRVMFPDTYGDLDAPFAAYHSMNDPVSGGGAIRAVVAAGHLVRTRADSDSEEPNALNYDRAEAALASGAQFISTDYPFPGDDESYGFTIPGGTPSRCNPISAPAECTSADIEDPVLLAE